MASALNFDGGRIYADETVNADQKKSRRFRRLLKLITGRRQNRVDRSHSVSKEDTGSHKRESLIDRKRTNFFEACLPCRPLADTCTGCCAISAFTRVLRTMAARC